MSEYGEMKTVTLEANGDLTALQYEFVIMTAANRVGLAVDAGVETLVGVLQNKPAAAGRAATVAVLGETKIVAGGSVTVNDLITTNASGRATAATSGDYVMGRALVAATNDGEVIRMILNPFFTGDLA